MLREQRLAEVFVELADTLVAQFDVVDFLYGLAADTVELLPIDATGIMLTDQRGALRTMASSSDEARLVELFVVQNDKGPCLECVRTGQALPNIDLTRSADRWPGFTAAAVSAGFGSCHVLPLRLRGDVVGAVNLFCTAVVELDEPTVALAQAMADVATIGLLQHRAVVERELLAEQLQTALNSRVVLEQAKGMLAERGGRSVSDAFTLMRGYARRTGQSLGLVAVGILDGSIETQLLTADVPARATSDSITGAVRTGVR